MTALEVMNVCSGLGILPDSGPHGIRIGSTGWRLERGSGIAGNLNEWWLRPIAGMYDPAAPDATAKPIGPLKTCAQLSAALRRKWKTQIANHSLKPADTTETPR
jgi:hypothetical protein